jgi:hypothetical protein
MEAVQALLVLCNSKILNEVEKLQICNMEACSDSRVYPKVSGLAAWSEKYK